MELSLGTVQFGLDYGIAGQRKPAPADAVKWLDYATQNGVRAIDTAAAYGTAEEVVGAFLKLNTVPRESLFLSTKLLPNVLDEIEPERLRDEVVARLEGSLKTLNTDYVDAYLLHSSRYAFRDDILEALQVARDRGLAREVGVSVYDPDEAFACFESGKVGFIQAPYSVFDHRMREAGVLARAAEAGCGMDTRSAFIQGLILMRGDEVPGFLSGARPILSKLDAVCADTGYTRIELAMAYVKRERAVSHLVFGVDSLGQLEEDIAAFEREVPEDVIERLDGEFEGIPADLVMPSLWKK